MRARASTPRRAPGPSGPDGAGAAFRRSSGALAASTVDNVVVAGPFGGILGLGGVTPTPAELLAMSHAKLAP